ncbi:MAG: hypothetical protein ACF8PG_01610 [Maioricimonas sp. JB045]|uniref:hypothetical protein n=1 Tax=Maioricimonas sp. JC845 TaxID=3232138 RepID=UPI00345A5D62
MSSATELPQADSPAEPSRQPLTAGEYVRSRLMRLGIFFVIYVLSIGPMFWPWYEGRYLNGSRLIAAFYEPLWILAGWIPPLGHLINWYVRFWIL